jgi:lipid A 3-O-deacylase
VRVARAAFALIAALDQTQPIPAAAADLFAPDEVAFNVGYGSHVNVFGVATSWKYSPMIRALDRPNLDTRLVAQLAYWNGRERPTPNSSVWDVGLMPMLRWTSSGEAATRPFVEGGIGINLLSSTRINNDRVFSTAFQFGEQAGLGATFGPEKKYSLEVYIQHVSNGNIKKPNDGLTNGGLLFRVSLR